MEESNKKNTTGSNNNSSLDNAVIMAFLTALWMVAVQVGSVIATAEIERRYNVKIDRGTITFIDTIICGVFIVPALFVDELKSFFIKSFFQKKGK